MALPDTPMELPQVRRRHRRDRVFAVFAAITMGAAVALWGATLVSGPVLGDGFTLVVSLTGALLTVAWLITSLERRIVAHLQQLEGARYRDGYAAGYVDAASKFRDGYERPGLRPVR